MPIVARRVLACAGSISTHAVAFTSMSYDEANDLYYLSGTISPPAGSTLHCSVTLWSASSNTVFGVLSNTSGGTFTYDPLAGSSVAIQGNTWYFRAQWSDGRSARSPNFTF